LRQPASELREEAAVVRRTVEIADEPRDRRRDRRDSEASPEGASRLEGAVVEAAVRIEDVVRADERGPALGRYAVTAVLAANEER
jgi:hypothetical protein